MRKEQPVKFIYLDNFSFNFLFRSFFYSYKKEVRLIEEVSIFNNFFIKILNFFGFNFKKLEFVSGHLSYNHENVYLKAREIAGKLSIDCACDIISSSITISNLNREFKEGTIELFISRYLQLEVEKWVSRILVVKALSAEESSDFKIFLCKPQIFNENIVRNYFLDLELHFYSIGIFQRFKIYLSFISSKLSTIKFIYHAFKRNTKKSFSENRSSVLCIQNDTIGIDKTKRRQPHWIEKEFSSDHNTYILSMVYSTNYSIEDEEELNQNNCYVVNPSVFLQSYRTEKNNKVLKLIFRLIGKSNTKFWTSNSYQEKYHLLKVNKLLLSSYLISAVALHLKTKVFIISEPQSIYSDALVLVSEKLCLTTIAVQYSNMTLISPLMMSNANVFCIFSEMYSSVFSYRNIKPDRFYVTGYIHNGLQESLIDEASKIRSYFDNLGVTFVLSYFDENVQDGRWAMYDSFDYIRDMEILAKSVISNDKLGVIIKTQFIINGPRDLLPNNVLIKQAFDTGRFIEVKSGNRRNDIYPAQVALASDLCIGHSYGATASLEAAVYGIRSVLINEYNVTTSWDYAYKSCNVLFESMESIISIILSNNFDISSIGDWRDIVHKFDDNKDFSAKEKFNLLIKRMLKDVDERMIS